MRWSGWPCVAALAVLLGAPRDVPIPALHPGPSVGIEFEVADRSVVAKLMGEQRTFGAWLGFPAGVEEWTAPLAKAEETRLLAAIDALFRDRNRIAIEGVTAMPRIAKLEVPPLDSTGYGVPALAFELHWDCSERPRRIEVVWGSFEELTWFDQVRMPLMFRELGDVTIGTVTPDEQSFLWHASLRPPKVVEQPVEQRVATADWPVPLGACGVLVLALALWPLARRAQPSRALRVALVASALGTAYLVRDLGVWSMPSPFATTRPRDEAAAAAIVDGLLRNLYAAFEGRREEEIYDALAVSVVPELRAELYGRIYESLILRSQGGAVCQIERVEIDDRRVELAAELEPWDLLDEARADTPRFLATWRWRAKGLVTHWGHAHRRENAYEARLWICLDAGAWRIGAFEVLDHSRVDSDG